VSGVLAGRLTKTGGSGGYTMTVSVFDAAKRNLLERCSASAKWTVAHNARTYGGSTSQGDPVAITLNAKRTRISDMYVAYHMDCGGGSYLEPGDDFTFVVRRGGRFGARFEDDVTIAGGGGASRKIFYDVGGIVRPTTAAGTLTVSTLEVDAAGNPQTVGCGTPDVTWKAMTG
jgi:hypothetical protein